MRTLLAAIFVWAAVLSVGTAASAQQQGTLDGNWWLAIPTSDPATKPSYVAGLIHGATQFGPQTLMTPKVGSAKDAKATDDEMAALALGIEVTTALRGLSVKQIVDGLDVFYSDFRNRGIDLPSAALVVYRQIAGMPKVEVEAWVEEMRSSRRK